MHHFLEAKMLAIECDRGIHVIYDVADLHSGHWKLLTTVLISNI